MNADARMARRLEGFDEYIRRLSETTLSAEEFFRILHLGPYKEAAQCRERRRLVGDEWQQFDGS